MNKSEKTIRELLETAGISINGDRPWDIQVHDGRFYDRVLRDASLGLGEAYMDGWWDCQQLMLLLTGSCGQICVKKVEKNLRLAWHILQARLFNRQSLNRSPEVADRHYDLGNDLYKAMLDKRLNYTCAYWADASNLDDAQEAKLDLVCRKIGVHAKA
jgi:cyclopropane-fatty-acyl-phospholipid synthase